jgi:diaminohydroxyphosphoribosylaminopyrimidine deaminase/5-amino-6-(5-phosphoribosylamino)uracil reductase
VPATGPLFEVTDAPTLVCTTDAAPAEARAAWSAAGAKVATLPSSAGGGSAGEGTAGGGVDLVAVLEVLAAEGVLQAMVEGGPTVHGSLLARGLVDRLVAYVAGAVLGPDGRAGFDAALPRAIADAPRFALLGARALGDDVRLDYAPLGRRQHAVGEGQA